MSDRGEHPEYVSVETQAFDIRSLDSITVDADTANRSLGGTPGRTQIMGVLNVTPDSFSDGGAFLDPDAAIEHGMLLAEQGADIIDVGGESTRPGAGRVPVETEQERVLPVIRVLAEQGIRVSIDTMNAATALAAADAGAALINDVSAANADDAMIDAVVSSGLPFIASHWRGHSTEMDARARYSDAARQVRDELFARIGELIVRGVDPARLVLDPGIGFAKTGDHNWQVLAHLQDFEQLGLPVLIGVSRKRFLADLLPEGASVEDRDVPTTILSALAAHEGVWGVRVHDVAGTRLALDIVEALGRGRGRLRETGDGSVGADDPGSAKMDA